MLALAGVRDPGGAEMTAAKCQGAEFQSSQKM